MAEGQDATVGRPRTISEDCDQGIHPGRQRESNQLHPGQADEMAAGRRTDDRGVALLIHATQGVQMGVGLVLTR